jgi:hypothetical protein
VTAIVDLLSVSDQRRLAERLAEWEAADQLTRSPGQQRPAPVPVPLHRLAAEPVGGDR